MKRDNIKCSQLFKSKEVEERKKEFNSKWISIINQTNKNENANMFYNK